MDSSTRAFLVLATVVAVAVGLAIWLSDALEPIEAPDLEDTPVARHDKSRKGTDRPPLVVRPPPINRPLSSLKGISGTVKYADGEPVDGAKVSLFLGKPPRAAVSIPKSELGRRTQVADLFQYYPDESGDLAPLGTDRPVNANEERPLDEAVTDEEGNFKFLRTPPGKHRVRLWVDRRPTLPDEE